MIWINDASAEMHITNDEMILISLVSAREDDSYQGDIPLSHLTGHITLVRSGF